MSSMTYFPQGEEPMTRFKIDTENNITAFGSSEQIEDSGGETEIFASRQELATLAKTWPATRLVEIWNSLPGIEPVERFTSQQAAVTRIWKAIQRLEPSAVAPKRPRSVRKPSSGKKPPRVAQKRAGASKTARVIALLERPKGATLKELMRATGWQTHSVRGLISGQLKKKLKLKVRSFKREGERVYSIKPR